ncbi:MAG: hypothetical protein EOM19_05285 [Candidatus Moranbacteria bacterium]|nr:hypothetical protein [Candidatus Moranbacteria bacterium]
MAEDITDYDKIIAKCIKNSYKTCREISNETGLDFDIVSRKLRQFRKYNMVYFRETQADTSKTKGIKPMKYKLNMS